MPVIPTFSPSLSAPNLSEAYLGRQRLQQQAASDAARIQLGYAELQQRAVENEMELAARKEALSREALRRAQEQEIDKAYRETQFGLRQRELQNEEALAQVKIQQAAREFEAHQQYGRIRAQKIAEGLDENEASKFAARAVGPAISGFSPSLVGSHLTPEQREEMSIRGKKLSSDLRNADAEMREKRALLDKTEKESEKNLIRGEIARIARRRNALFQEQQSTSPQATTVNPSFESKFAQSPDQMMRPTPRSFIGAPTGVDKSEFPMSSPIQIQGPEIPQSPGGSFIGLEPPSETAGTPFTVFGRGGQTASGIDFSLKAPKAGDVRKGYRFKGGDPSNKNNWEKVK